MLTTLAHPLAAHLLTRLRDRTTSPAEFRSCAHRVAVMLALDATRDLPVRTLTVETPLTATTGTALARSLVIVPVLRSGLGMVEPFLELFPEVAVGHVGLERDHVTAQARSYYCKLPPLAGRRTLVVDPMLATGGSAIAALDVVLAQGADDVALVCIVSSPEGIAAVHARHPAVRIFTAVVDAGLDARKYIVPGLGDFGDRLYAT